jgi:hypothetical protein
MKFFGIKIVRYNIKCIFAEIFSHRSQPPTRATQSADNPSQTAAENQTTQTI